MKINKKRIIEILFFIIIFLLFFVFFYKVHPITLLDTDDWHNAYFSRSAYPLIGGWNPTKIFPETIMPMCITAGVRFLSIFSNNYLNNIVIVNSFIVSIFITIYFYFFYKLVRDKYNNKLSENILITIFFLLLHFLIFRIYEMENNYMFHAISASCYYHYLIPALINCSLVMYLLGNGKLYFKDNKIKTGFMLLIVYLSLFSNLFSSIILATYIAITLLFRLIDDKVFKKKKISKNLITFIKKNNYEILILVVWVIVQILELTGGRAAYLISNQEHNFITTYKEVINYTLRDLISFNFLFSIILFTSFIVGNIIFFKRKLYHNRKVFSILISFILCSIYITLLCAKSSSWYMIRMEVIFVMIFYIFLCISLILSYLIKKYNKIMIFLPILIFIMLFEIYTERNTFRESNLNNFNLSTCNNITTKIIDQIIEADGKEDTIIYIPYFDEEKNWPITAYDSYNYVMALNKHGIIDKYANYKYVISEEYYEDILGKK